MTVPRLYSQRYYSFYGRGAGAYPCYAFLLVGQVGLEPTTALSTDFTDQGDTNYTVLTHIYISITRWPSPYIHNLYLYSTNEETSLSFGERLLTSCPSLTTKTS